MERVANPEVISTDQSTLKTGLVKDIQTVVFDGDVVV